MNGEISLKLTSDGQKSLKDLMESEEMPENLKRILTTKKSLDSISLPEMIEIAEWRCKKYNDNVECVEIPTVHSILKDSSMELPTLPEPEENPELKERLKKLRAQQARKEYNKMVENISHREPSPKTKNPSRATVISGLNFAVTLFATCGGTMYLLKDVIPDAALRAGIGIAVGTVVLLIEIYLAVREIDKQTSKVD